MRRICFILFFGIIQNSCNLVGESRVSSISSKGTNQTLDSLSTYLLPTHYTLYTIDFEKFDISIFEGKSEMELILNDVPFKADEQRKYLFSQFLKRVNTAISHVPEYSEERIIDLLGKPTKKYPVYSRTEEIIVLEYKLNSGFKCPDCSVPFHRIFENCDYIRFQFNNGRLEHLYFDIYYSGLAD